MPEAGSWYTWASVRWARITAKVGGAITSGWPSARAASGSRWTGCGLPMATANSAIFSRPTSYTADGGYTRPARSVLSAVSLAMAAGYRAPGRAVRQQDARQHARTAAPVPGRPFERVRSAAGSAGLAVRGVLAAARAELG